MSKIHYGLRLPETLLMIPLAHNRAPFVNGESYIDAAQLPYRRLPGLEPIDRFDPVVFNVPAGDSVYVMPWRTYYPHDFVGYKGGDETLDEAIKRINSGEVKLITRPRDKRDHYVKRAIGLPGETLEIKERQVFINGEPVTDPENVQYTYRVQLTKKADFELWSDWDITSTTRGDDYRGGEGDLHVIMLNQRQVDQLQAWDSGAKIEFAESAKDDYRYYPHNKKYFGGQSTDNYGPVRIPARGMTVKLDERTHALYWRAIRVYEEHPSYEQRGKQFFLNGQAITEYTFKQDYYWMMGDNRHNSEDSRIWGFVPEDHILGKPLFVWMSLKENSLFKGVNWHRIGRSGSKTGGE